MRVSRQLLLRSIVLGLILLLGGVSLTGPRAVAAEGLCIEDVDIDGATLRVTVYNASDHAVSGVVFGEVLTEDGEVGLHAPVIAQPGARAVVTLHAKSSILGVTVLGAVLDDGSPF